MHFHTLILEGVFTTAPDGTTRFDPAPPPTDREVAQLLAAVRTRILRLLRRRGVLAADDASDLATDPLADAAPVLAELTAAAVRGRSAFGDRAGTPVLRVGREPDAPWVATVGRRHAHLACFDLHADRAVPADDRAGLERLCRYLLRPPLAQDRLTRLTDGRIVCTLARPWHDGTRHLIFTPHEFLERLAAITPRPHINLVLYHGVLAPRARWRPPAPSAPAISTPLTRPPAPSLPLVPVAAAPTSTPPSSAPAVADPDPPAPSCAVSMIPTSPVASHPSPSAERTRRAWAWADLMRRVFALDVLACTACSGRLRFLATIEDPPVVAKILAHLGLPTAAPALTPARPPPEPAGFDVA
ncbi:MAG: transposase [Deltaproteobacteria bacterium]|nr:transposase [Deltaproteobacteria bacterium]